MFVFFPLFFFHTGHASKGTGQSAWCVFVLDLEMIRLQTLFPLIIAVASQTEAPGSTQYKFCPKVAVFD